jgi:hypothetical protein
MDLDGPDYASECDYDVLPHTIEYDPYEIPFMYEYSIDTLLPWTYQNKDKLENTMGRSQVLSKF